jgi:hypothetical protein
MGARENDGLANGKLDLLSHPQAWLLHEPRGSQARMRRMICAGIILGNAQYENDQLGKRMARNYWDSGARCTIG